VSTNLADDYAGRSVFISGGSSGVGAELARVLGRLGARVSILGRSEERLAQVAAEVERLGGTGLAIRGDVRHSGEVEHAIDQTIEGLGGLDLAVACAGIGDRCPLEKIDDATWNEYIETNLTGAFWVCRAAGLRMKTRGSGTIITVASGLGLVGMAGQVAYCASKGGMVVMTRALAAELAPNVRVNCFAPGGIETPMTDQDFAVTSDPVEARTRALARVPLGRLATPLEAAEAIAWMGSSAFGYATGSVVSMDGGTTAV
jgi:NAD(P)-dependent dehydrogenase (short-subunit alcohol dehydrogenase family)